MILSFCVPGCSMEIWTVVSVRADPSRLVVFGAIDVRAVVEGAVPPSDGPPPSLVQEMPVEAGEGPVLGALVLQEERALLCAELLKVCVVRRFLGLRRSARRSFRNRRHFLVKTMECACAARSAPGNWRDGSNAGSGHVAGARDPMIGDGSY